MVELLGMDNFPLLHAKVLVPDPFFLGRGGVQDLH